MISYDAASNYMKLFCCFLPFPRRSASITIGIMQKTAEFNNISLFTIGVAITLFLPGCCKRAGKIL